MVGKARRSRAAGLSPPKTSGDGPLPRPASGSSPDLVLPRPAAAVMRAPLWSMSPHFVMLGLPGGTLYLLLEAAEGVADE